MAFNPRRAIVGVCLCCAVLLAGYGPGGAQAAATVEEAIKARVAQIQSGTSLKIAGVTVAAEKFIPKFYALRDYRPAWTDQANVEALLTAVRTSDEQGLDPADFHVAVLEEMKSNGQNGGPAAQADFDVALTDSLVRLGSQIFDGKVDPVALDAAWNFDARVLDQEPEVLVNDAIDAGGVAALLRDLEPQHPFYGEMKSVLAAYREIAAKGGWPRVPEGPALKVGSDDPRVAVLRQRLVATGDLSEANAANPNSFDAALDEAVKRFQERHGLEADGAVGPGTLAAMNVPVETRIDQIRVNLERTRWVLPALTGRLIIVNIAGFRTYVVKDGVDEEWSTRSIVGKAYHKTPVFRGEMDHLVINPTWTVPRGILGRSIIPKAKEDPSYLTQNNFTLVAGDGKRVDPSSVNWSKASAKSFPYQVVQGPGPNNALGQVKFMFPNKYAVYLHDTPDKSLFEKSERAFSSGCVRLDNPFELAELLLKEESGWDRARIDEVLASGKTETVKLSKKMPVLIQYWTVDVGSDDGTVLFLNDVYERDAKILEGLNAAYVLRE